MQSKYNRATQKRLTPPWCRKTLAPVIPPIVNGKPQYLVAYLQWKDTDEPDHLPDVTASTRLPWDAAANAWQGHDSGPGFTLGGKVTEEAEVAEFTFQVQLWKDSSQLETIEWINVVMGPEFPWSSSLVEFVFLPGLDKQSMQIYV